MKRKTVLLMMTALLLLVGGTGCEREELLPKNQAQGKVLFITGSCAIYGVYIEVDNPKGIGMEGTYTKNRSSTTEEVVEYNNAIIVPYFSRINLPPELMKEGTWLHFEYREVTKEDRDKGLLRFTEQIIICHPGVFAPPGTPYIITKIIAHKP